MSGVDGICISPIHLKNTSRANPRIRSFGAGGTPWLESMASAALEQEVWLLLPSS